MNKQLLVLIIFISAVSLIAWQYLLPKFNEVFGLRDELHAWQTKLDETQNLRTKLAGLEKKYAGMADEADKVSQALPAKQDIPGLLIQLEELSSQNGLILQGVGFSAAEVKKSKAPVVTDESAGAAVAPASGAQGIQSQMGQGSTPGNLGAGTPSAVKILTVDLSLSGAYSSLASFVKSVENNLRIMDITAINFSGQKGETSAVSANQDFKISLNTYFRE